MRTPFERFKKSLTQDNLWIYILILLKKENLYPYEIKKKINKIFGFKPSTMTIYLVINRLKFGGYITVEKTTKDRGPEKTYYKIIEKGKKELEKARRFYKELNF
ncbi:MAG TPA: PadR family transcriptional regulator [Candidatus Omnitrophica bacterium]|nr:PadR family transcriptional regulator [Candidatus Omnitrophota bacterium]